MNEGGAGPHSGLAGSPGSGGTLVIRTWLEYGEAPPGFRARVTYGSSAGPDQASVSANDPERVLNLVRQWLMSQTAGQGRR